MFAIIPVVALKLIFSDPPEKSGQAVQNIFLPKAHLLRALNKIIWNRNLSL
jgi:hypothetical protein